MYTRTQKKKIKRTSPSYVCRILTEINFLLLKSLLFYFHYFVVIANHCIWRLVSQKWGQAEWFLQGALANLLSRHIHLFPSFEQMCSSATVIALLARFSIVFWARWVLVSIVLRSLRDLLVCNIHSFSSEKQIENYSVVKLLALKINLIGLIQLCLGLLRRKTNDKFFTERVLWINEPFRAHSHYWLSVVFLAKNTKLNVLSLTELLITGR